MIFFSLAPSCSTASDTAASVCVCVGLFRVDSESHRNHQSAPITPAGREVMLTQAVEDGRSAGSTEAAAGAKL